MLDVMEYNSLVRNWHDVNITSDQRDRPDIQNHPRLHPKMDLTNVNQTI